MGRCNHPVVIGAVFLSIILGGTCENAAGIDYELLKNRSVVTVYGLDSSGQLVSIGSGFFIEKGYVLTDYHVVRGTASTFVGFSDGRRYRVTHYLYSESADIAFLETEVVSPAPLALRFISSPPKLGEPITVLGSPRGLEFTISSGLVSSDNRVVNGMTLFQISAPVSHGSSGGPVLDTDGNVVGVVDATFENGQNLNLAIPATTVEALLQNVKAVAKLSWAFPPKANTSSIPSIGVTPAEVPPAGSKAATSPPAKSQEVGDTKTQLNRFLVWATSGGGLITFPVTAGFAAAVYPNGTGSSIEVLPTVGSGLNYEVSHLLTVGLRVNVIPSSKMPVLGGGEIVLGSVDTFGLGFMWEFSPTSPTYLWGPVVSVYYRRFSLGVGIQSVASSVMEGAGVPTPAGSSARALTLVAGYSIPKK